MGQPANWDTNTGPWSYRLRARLKADDLALNNAVVAKSEEVHAIWQHLLRMAVSQKGLFC
jgi:hypothetical protein